MSLMSLSSSPRDPIITETENGIHIMEPEHPWRFGGDGTPQIILWIRGKLIGSLGLSVQ